MLHAPHNALPASHGHNRDSRSVVAWVAACILLTALVFCAPANAADAQNRQHAIEIALQQNGGSGKVLGVNTVQNRNGTIVFEVKVLTNGRVRVLRINKAQ